MLSVSILQSQIPKLPPQSDLRFLDLGSAFCGVFGQNGISPFPFSIFDFWNPLRKSLIFGRFGLESPGKYEFLGRFKNLFSQFLARFRPFFAVLLFGFLQFLIWDRPIFQIRQTSLLFWLEVTMRLNPFTERKSLLSGLRTLLFDLKRAFFRAFSGSSGPFHPQIPPFL